MGLWWLKGSWPDGLTFNFYRATWSLIGDELFHVVFEFFRIGKMPKGVNISYVTQCLRTHTQQNSWEFRPISLIHGVYKIVGKMLSSWIWPIMTIIIDPQQTTFISGRQILDGFMIANEIMHRIKKDWREGFLLKVGFNKAFNPVN